MADAWLPIGAALLVGGGWLLAKGLRKPAVRSRHGRSEVPHGCLPVLPGEEVIQQAGADGLLASIRSKIGLARANYERDYLPALHKYAEFVQLLPASESHHHAHPGGLLTHALEAVDIALTLRRGVVLPIGAHPEDLMHHEHRWTYGVFIATLLHDIGRPVADLVVTASGQHAPGGKTWTPMAGTLVEIGADYYRVAFTDPVKRNYQAHTRLGVAMLNRVVPQPTLAWLAEDSALMDELTVYLYGEAKGGALRDLSTKADGESVRRNLLTGPRTRFATSRAVPLIERMMEALRRMLAEGGLLPLNRSGAAGWVFEGDIWFVSKRIADEVRKYLQAHESSAGIPGEDKNDRLFDVWQEYGALVSNPETGGAIWHARVEGDGYVHTFTMLRFPLHLLFPSQDHYPPPMAGRMVVVDKRTAKNPISAEAIAERHDAAAADFEQLGQIDSEAAVKIDPVSQPDLSADIFDRLAALGGIEPVATTETDDVFLGGTYLGAEVTEAIPVPTIAAERERPRLEARAPHKPPRTPMPMPAEPRARVLAPVVPHTQPPPVIRGKNETPVPAVPEGAQQLMAWIQAGIASGELVYNVTGALIHFVEEEGANVMLLVSPRIFRHYLESTGSATGEPEDKLGSALQKAFFKAGWHRVGPKKTNIFRYQVKRRNSDEGSFLAAVVIPQPERFVNPVPPSNPHITLYQHDPAGMIGKAGSA